MAQPEHIKTKRVLLTLYGLTFAQCMILPIAWNIDN